MSSSQGLIGLAYCSTATFRAAPGSFGVHPEVSRILRASRRNNRRDEIGGLLHFRNGYFFQYLEGDAALVDRVYARIGEDSRHTRLELLTRAPIERRRFSDWSMKFVMLEQSVDRVLERAGLERFDPYAFTPGIVEQLIEAGLSAPEAFTGSRDEARTRPRRPGLLTRLFGRPRAG